MKKNNRIHLLSDEHLCAIGDVIVAFNYLEHSVQQIFQVILSPNLSGRVICARIGFRQLRDFTLAIYQSVYGDDDDYKMLVGLFAEIEEIEEERNRVAHCVWTAAKFDPASGQHFDISTLQTKIAKKRTLRYDLKKTPLDELKQISDRIRDINKRVYSFDFSHYDRKKYLYVQYQK